MKVQIEVLSEAGYQCAAPGCPNFEVDLHHIEDHAKGGPDTPANLVVLCVLHHRRVTNGQIPQAAVRTWKHVVMARGSPLDRGAFDLLAFLKRLPGGRLVCYGDGLLPFAKLVGAGMVQVDDAQPSPTVHGSPPYYGVRMTDRGRRALSGYLDGKPYDEIEPP